MWKKIKDTSYYIDVTIDDHYEVFITDFVKIWSYSFSRECFIQALMQSEDNLGLEIETEELLDKGAKLLSSPDKLCYASLYEQDLPHGTFLIVNLSIDLGFAFGIDMNLVLGSAELFFMKVTKPLLNIVRDLKESENVLRDLVIKKDEEIIEYKTQGGKIKYTALRPYSDTEHMNKHECYKNFFDSIRDPQNVFNKTVDKCQRPGREPEIKPTSIKAEPSVETSAFSHINDKVTTKEEPTDNIITIKEEPSSETIAQINNSVSSKQSNWIPVKVEPSSENVDSSQANNLVTASTVHVEVKNEFKPFVPKKRRLNI